MPTSSGELIVPIKTEGNEFPESFLRVDPGTPVRQQLLETLRQAIYQARFKSGQRLVERELCEITGVSRTSLREAMRQLESEGLVQIIPNKGPIVRAIEREEARRIYELRAVLEGFLARQAAKFATDKDIAQLRAIVSGLTASLDTGKAQPVIEMKRALDEKLMRIAGNQTFNELLGRLHGRINLLRATTIMSEGRQAASLNEISEIVEAIANGDADRAERKTQTHINNAAQTALSIISS